MFKHSILHYPIQLCSNLYHFIGSPTHLLCSNISFYTPVSICYGQTCFTTLSFQCAMFKLISFHSSSTCYVQTYFIILCHPLAMFKQRLHYTLSRYVQTYFITLPHPSAMYKLTSLHSPTISYVQTFYYSLPPTCYVQTYFITFTQPHAMFKHFITLSHHLLDSNLFHFTFHFFHPPSD